MKQEPEDQGLTPNEPLPYEQEIHKPWDLRWFLDRGGAEPYWMQDVRCAQRRINDERARLRAARESSRAESE